MLMDVVNDITNAEVEGMAKVFNNSTAPVIYSLSQELLDNITELALFEKKIALSNALLTKLNNQENQEQIYKLKKEKEGFEEQKLELISLIKKLELIQGSTKDFTLFFIFLKRFYTLAIEKGNFEQTDKNISSKLISNLKNEEENLYNEFVEGDCFSKVLFVLPFEMYQCYFKEYAKNFFDNIQHSSDPYANSLLILKAVLYECAYFNANFNLTTLKLFLSQHIPAHVPLPSANSELVALRCFFYYELLLDFLKLKLVQTNFEHLKKAVNLELNIVNYKANAKDTLIVGLNYLQEALGKIDKKYNDFLGSEPEEKEAHVNQALVFYNIIENEIQVIHKKTNNLINNKYMNLTKMRRMLAIIVNETHLPKFLELFNVKTGNDFSLNKMGQPEFIETNKEALNYLFHAICRDEFYTPLNTRVNLFINKLTESYPKDDISVLDSLELEDLIEFSFYYIFTLLYTDFNASLKGFNRQLLYTELVTLSIFANFKLKDLEVLEKRKNEEINKFFEKTFKNKVEYSLHKKNILEEIKLNLDTFQDIRRILSDTKSLEDSLKPKLESSLVPMPEKNLLIDSLKGLEKKQKICELEYQKVEKHKFINKPKSITLIKTNETQSKKNTAIECNKAIEYFYESLSCLSENLSETLKHIKENTQDINQFRQKISSAIGQISLSIQKLLSSLNGWKNPNESRDLSNLSLPKLLELVEELVIKNTSIVRKDQKKKLTQLRELLNNSSSSIELLIGQVNSVINKYHNYNNEAKKILGLLSTSVIKNHIQSQFFAKNSLTKKVKRQINGKLSNDYIRLKEQSNGLEKIIRLIKCDTDVRVIKLYAVIVEADDYQKTYELLNEKINLFKNIPNKKFNDLRQDIPFIKDKKFCDEDKKVDVAHGQLIEVIKAATSENVTDAPIKKIASILTPKCVVNENRQLDLVDSISIQGQLDVEKKSAEESLLTEFTEENLSNNSNLASKNLLEDYERWNVDFEVWKNEKHTKLYELFHIIETCSKSVLDSSAKAFLTCLSFYQEECAVKNDELRMKENQITPYFKSSNQTKVMISYLSQYQKWFDEVFHRILLCRTLILQNEDNPVVQESPRLPSPLADNRAEFKNLLTFYLGATDKYNKFRDDLISEENELNNLNRSFIKQILMLGSLNGMDNEENVLSDFSKQLDRVNQLKLAIEQEFETKQKIKEKLSLLASPEIVKFYLSRIDPSDADSLKNPENYLPPIETTNNTNCVFPIPSPEYNIYTAPTTFYYLPSPMPAVYPVDMVQPHNPIFYSM
ncbi:hypothetical protein [Rickettsiella endosymbiont of Miltochrista miniata]|uniref:hypothetical protein n=1 Tax=Rickettsiella endosymbiont of Miltochrista miniata TaxID=3066239 RepID=UPI00313C5757